MYIQCMSGIYTMLYIQCMSGIYTMLSGVDDCGSCTSIFSILNEIHNQEPIHECIITDT